MGSPTVAIDAGGVTANGLQFDATGYVINGPGTLTLGGAPPITVTTAGQTATINAALAGTSGFTNNGLGTLVLTGNNSGLTGAVTISSGIVRATTSANALGAGTLSLSGGELQLANDTGLIFGRNTTVSGATQITIDRVTAGVGGTDVLNTLNIGAQTLTVTSGTNVTSGTGGLIFGATTLTGASIFNVTNGGAGNTRLSLGSINAGANTATFMGNGNTTLLGVVSGSGGITFTGSGTLTLAAANTYTGTTSLNSTTGGTVLLTSPTGLGPAANATVAFGSGSTNALSLNGNNITLASLSTTGTIVTPIVQSGSSAAGADTLTVNNASPNTFGGVLQNGGTRLLALTKGGAGNLTLTGTNALTGVVTINAGTLTLAGTGGTLATPVGVMTINNGANLTIDNTTAGGGNNNNRLSDTNTSGLTFNGGTFIYKGSDAGNSTETIGNITLTSGASAITLTFGGANTAVVSGGTSQILSRSAGGGVAFINGVNLGQNDTGTASVARLKFTTAPSFVGQTTEGGTAKGTTKTLGIIPYLVGSSDSATGLGTAGAVANTFLTYGTSGSVTGLRPLDRVNEFTQNAFTANNNTRITTTSSLAGGTTINSLLIDGANLTISSGTETVGSGAVLFATSNSILTNTLGFGANEGFIYLSSGVSATISSVISGTNATNGLTISGPGTLNMTATSIGTYTGAVNINGATVNILVGTNLGSGVAHNVNLNNGGTVGVGFNYTVGATTNNFVIGTGGGVFNVANTFTFTLGTANQLTGSGPLTIVGNSTGILVMGAANTYSGAALIKSGTVNLGAAGNSLGSGGATNTITLGDSTGGNVTLTAGAAATQANPIIVAGTGTLTISQTGAVSSVYSGPVALNSNLVLTASGASGSPVNMSGLISGAGSLTINAGTSGALVNLSATSTYTGTTTMNTGSGTLRLGAANAGSKYSAITLAATSPSTSTPAAPRLLPLRAPAMSPIQELLRP